MGGKNDAQVSERGVENKYNYRDRVIRDKRYKLYVKASPQQGFDKLIDLRTDFNEKNNLLDSQDPDIIKVKQALQKVAGSMPNKDNDPKYNKVDKLPWDKPVVVKSQEWKK
jgi:arylsulfatase A-like enzyme